MSTGISKSCEVSANGWPNVQVIDEVRRIIYYQSASSGPQYKLDAFVDMNTCLVKKLPAMDGFQQRYTGGVTYISGRRVIHSLGGIWDADTGETIIRTCK